MVQTQTINRYSWLWLLVILSFFLHKPILRIFFIFDYQESIQTIGHTYGIDPHLLGAVIFVESRFDPAAKSKKGAVGLMQIMPTTGEWVAHQLGWKDFRLEDLVDPVKNLELGCWYLAYLKKYFNGNEVAALAAYNAGHRYVQDWIDTKVWEGDLVKIENIPFVETKKYLFQINAIRKIYRYLYPDLTLNSA